MQIKNRMKRQKLIFIHNRTQKTNQGHLEFDGCNMSQ